VSAVQFRPSPQNIIPDDKHHYLNRFNNAVLAFLFSLNLIKFYTNFNTQNRIPNWIPIWIPENNQINNQTGKDLIMVNLSKMVTLLENTGRESRTLHQYISSLTYQANEGEFSADYIEQCLTDLYLLSIQIEEHFKEIHNEFSDVLRPALTGEKS